MARSSPLLLLLISPWVAFALPAQARAQPDQSSTESELLHLETVWNDAHLHADADALARLWDDDLIVIVPKMDLIRKTDAIGMLRSGHMTFLRYETSDLSTKVFGDTAIVVGRLDRTRKMGERRIQDAWRFSKVYVRRNGQWRVVLWQASDWPAQASP
ncbi:MAG: nuclear transport factor 2 family protein [Chthoniobacterales bacterium]